MESMHSLNSSLDSDARRRRERKADLLQALRGAAVSVTSLYKAALSEVDRAHAQGYQQALRELIRFVDRELATAEAHGEGVRVRHWATQRLDPTRQTVSPSESDEDDVEEQRRDDSRSSPSTEHASSEHTRSAPPRSRTPDAAAEAAPDADAGRAAAQTGRAPSFSFRAGPPLSAAAPDLVATPCPSARTRPRRLATRRRPSAAGLNASSAQKRKLPLTDFLDFAGFSDRRDAFGGGSKRSKMI